MKMKIKLLPTTNNYCYANHVNFSNVAGKEVTAETDSTIGRALVYVTPVQLRKIGAIGVRGYRYCFLYSEYEVVK